jgi:threonine synthase
VVAITHLACIHCQARWSPHEVHYTCPTCGDDDGLLDICYDYDAVARQLDRGSLAANPDPTIRRWGALLPLDGVDRLPPLATGGTPLYEVPSLASLLGVRQVRVKDDGRNPTASFKDRASAVAVARARELGESLIVAASTGNAASSLAGQAAAVGLRTVIFVPKRAPAGKIAQLLIYGARVAAVDGTYDDACDLALAATREYGWYNRNTGYNPYCLEGKKTAALELAEQYGWEVPDKVLVSVGDGCILAGIYKGFYDLHRLGWIERMPQMIAVQSTASNAISQAFFGRGPARIEEATTLADSISVNRPRVAGQALRALHATQGTCVEVDDADIFAAVPLLARHSGVFAEPSAAAVLAGALAMARSGQLRPDERIALVATGHGLKDVAGAMRAVDAQATLVAPTREGLLSYAKEQDLA